MRPIFKAMASPAIKVIIIFGIVSMLGDMVYETARSANSQYLNLLGISATQVGLVFGIGEFLGYFIRLVAGYGADKSGRLWPFMFFGYGLLLVVPLMGLTMNWNILIVLILMERIGKALRSPAKDTILSGVAQNDVVGIGFAFGIQEALDQIGAFLGPLLLTGIFLLSGQDELAQYQIGYRSLLIPFVLVMVFLMVAHRRIQKGNLLQPPVYHGYQVEKLQPVFWLYTAFTFFCTLGFVNFATIGYHLKATALMSDGTITLVYSVAMVVDAICALVVGKYYDRLKIKTGLQTGGILILAAIPVITIFLPLLTLSDSPVLIILGMIVFGVVMGTHETIMRSAIADLTPYHKRGTGYGVFNTSYGLALLIGAALMGLLYDLNQIAMITGLTIAVELIALSIYLRISWRVKTKK